MNKSFIKFKMFIITAVKKKIFKELNNLFIIIWFLTNKKHLFVNSVTFFMCILQVIITVQYLAIEYTNKEVFIFLTYFRNNIVYTKSLNRIR